MSGRSRGLPALLVLTTLAGCEQTSDPVEPGAASSAAAIAVVSGGGQPAFVGTRLDEPIVFRTVDVGGLPVAGVSVDFVTTPGSGQVEPARATTDQNGDVAIAWTIGPDPGTQTVLVAGGSTWRRNSRSCSRRPPRRRSRPCAPTGRTATCRQPAWPSS